jgi:hypothetical protein
MEVGIYFNYLENGPGKVVKNLIKGFDLLGIKYSLNTDGDVNIILQNVPRINGDISNCLLGPNIAVLPIDNKYLLEHGNYLKCLVPSEWVKNKYSRWIPENKISVWPVGIDTNKFINFCDTENKEYDFLVYFKRRNIDDLLFIRNFLTDMNKSFITVEYGSYTDEDLINLISKCRYGFIIDGCESQGLAIQEMLSCDLPLIVWDKKYWEDRGDDYKILATSIPYFDENCGVYFFNKDEIDDKFSFFLQKKYSPRKYIENNLSIDISTKKIISIINESIK